MNELKCPNCGTVFQIDEQDYESIVKQIRDKEFEKALQLREEQHKNDKETAIKLAEIKKLPEDIPALLEHLETEEEYDRAAAAVRKFEAML